MEGRARSEGAPQRSRESHLEAVEYPGDAKRKGHPPMECAPAKTVEAGRNIRYESGGRLERHGRQRSGISAPGTRGKEGRRGRAIATICAVALPGQAAVVLPARGELDACSPAVALSVIQLPDAAGVSRCKRPRACSRNAETIRSRRRSLRQTTYSRVTIATSVTRTAARRSSWPNSASDTTPMPSPAA